MQIQITGCMFENMGRNMNTKSKVIVLPCEAYDEERIYTLMKNGLSLWIPKVEFSTQRLVKMFYFLKTKIFLFFMI